MGMDLGPYRGIISHACGENIYPQADGSFKTEPTPAMRRALDEIDRAMNLIPVEIFNQWQIVIEAISSSFVIYNNSTLDYSGSDQLVDFDTRYAGREDADIYAVDGDGIVTISRSYTTKFKF
jgi:hypothetical protein